MNIRESLLASIEDVKGEAVSSRIESGGDLVDLVDSLDLLEILIAFDHRVGVVTNPQDLPESLDDLDSVVSRLVELHASH